jgi:hypothetical protein
MASPATARRTEPPYGSESLQLLPNTVAYHAIHASFSIENVS